MPGSARRSLVAIAAILVAGCPDDAPLDPFDATLWVDSEGGDTRGPIETSAASTIDPTLPDDDGDDDGGSTSGGEDDVDDVDGDSSTGPPPTDDGSSGPVDECGNGVVDTGEACDGAALGGADCSSQGFDAGTLACAPDCTAFDTALCVTWECGNDEQEGDEICDGEDLADEDCESRGYDEGALACSARCDAFDESLCVNWECGNDEQEGDELCDGEDLDGETCLSLGLSGGTLSCADGCGGFEIGACECDEQDIAGATGAGVASGSTVTEDDTLAPGCVDGGNDRVIAFTPAVAGDYQIDTAGSDYDTALAAFGSCDASSELACNDDTVGLTSQVSVPIAGGQTVLIVVDGYDGETGAWVLNIALEASACAEQSLGSATGTAVASGTTVGQDEDFTQSCGSGGAVDFVLSFVAPATGTYTVDTEGSDFDTVLSVYDSCDPESELDCNDDTVGLTSEISGELLAGQQVFIVVSGFAGDTGAWQLNIDGP